MYILGGKLRNLSCAACAVVFIFFTFLSFWLLMSSSQSYQCLFNSLWLWDLWSWARHFGEGYEVGCPLPIELGTCGASLGPPVGSGAQPQPKKDLKNYDLEIWPLLSAFNWFLEKWRTVELPYSHANTTCNHRWKLFSHTFTLLHSEHL